MATSAAPPATGSDAGSTVRKPPARPTSPILAGMVLVMANFMVVLDLTIANVSVPHIAGDLAISADEGTWIITSYAVAEAICVPLTGWLSQRFGAVKLFLLALSGFCFFSLLCGLSNSLTMIVICRIGQGLCGGPIMPMSQTLLLKTFPPEKRGMAMGMWAMTVTLGPALGPVLGGYLSDQASWHWVFLINVPIGIVGVAAGYMLLRGMETPIVKKRIDTIGLGLMVFWIGCLQIMLDIGRDRDWFGDPLIVVLAVLAVIGFSVFIVWELTTDDPIVDLRIFRHRGFAAGVATLAMSYGAFFAGIVVIPQWLQLTQGYTATKAGLVTAFQGIGAVLTSQIAARLIGKVDVRILISGGVVWMGFATLIRTRWTSGSDFWDLAIPILLQGIALPFMFISLTTLTLGSVRPEETASAAGLQNFIRTLATAIATSTVLTIWGNAQRTGRNDIVGRLNPADTERALHQSGMGLDRSIAMISNLVDKEATALAIDHTFYIAAALLFVSAAFVWLSPKAKGGSVPVSGH